MSKLFTAISFILISYSLSFPQESNSPNEFFTLTNRLNFGEYLFSQKDYLRAIDEFNAYLVHYENDTVKFKTGYCYSEIGRYVEAEKIFYDLSFSSNLSDEARYEYLKAEFKLGDFSAVQSNTSADKAKKFKFDNEFQKLKSISYLMQDSSPPDSSLVLSPFDKREIMHVRSLYMRKKYPSYKSPVAAGIMSAVIPGSGKIYAGEIGDGITSFLFTGILTFLAYDNFRADHQTRAWIFTGLAAFFYAGNIYGSAAAAQIYNAGFKFNLDQEINFFIGNKNYFTPNYGFIKN